MLVQRQIRDQALELTVFVSQLPQFAQLAYPYSGIPSLPDIERLLRHAHFPANVADLLPGLDLPHREQNLFFAMTFSRHPCSSCCLRSEDHIHPPDSTFPLSHFWVLGHFWPPSDLPVAPCYAVSFLIFRRLLLFLKQFRCM